MNTRFNENLSSFTIREYTEDETRAYTLSPANVRQPTFRWVHFQFNNSYTKNQHNIIPWKDRYHKTPQGRYCKHHHTHPECHLPQKQPPKLISIPPISCVPPYLQPINFSTETLSSTHKKISKQENLSSNSIKNRLISTQKVQISYFPR